MLREIKYEITEVKKGVKNIKLEESKSGA
jgi:hypothetical protein